MHCPKCGDAIEPNEKFCNKCGSPITQTNANMNNTNTTNNSVFVPNEISTTGNMTQPQPIQQSVQMRQQPIMNQQPVQPAQPQPLYPNNIQNHNNVQPMQNNIYNQPNVHMQTSTPQVPQHKPISPIRKILAGAGIGVIILLIFVLVLFVIGSSTDYYYSDNSYEDDVPTITQPKPQTQPQSGTRPTKTVIITDNKHEGVKISTKEEATKLIIEDSVSQKGNCPTEILAIENKLIEKYDITAVNLCELDINFAKEIDKVFEVIYNEYPSARGILTNFAVTNPDEKYIAAFLGLFPFTTANTSNELPTTMKTQIFLNTTYYFNLDYLEKSMNNNVKARHFPKNANKYSPIAHELAHYLSFISTLKSYDLDSILIINNKNVSDLNNVIRDWNNGVHSLSMIKTAYNNYKKDTNTTLGFDEWRATISGYAVATNNAGEYLYDETIAEAFHDVYLNGNNAADASKYIVEVLKSELEG